MDAHITRPVRPGPAERVLRRLDPARRRRPHDRHGVPRRGLDPLRRRAAAADRTRHRDRRGAGPGGGLAAGARRAVAGRGRQRLAAGRRARPGHRCAAARARVPAAGAVPLALRGGLRVHHRATGCASSRAARSGSGWPAPTARRSRSAAAPCTRSRRRSGCWALTEFPGINEEKVTRLHGIAEAALDGRLDRDRLRAPAGGGGPGRREAAARCRRLLRRRHRDARRRPGRRTARRRAHQSRPAALV